MGQFKPMVKMETTEPSVILKLKKGGHVAMKSKGEDGYKPMRKMDGGVMGALAGTPALVGRPALNAPVASPGRPSMNARRKAMMMAQMMKQRQAAPAMSPAMPAPVMKKGGKAEGGKMDKSQDKAMIKKAFKQHDTQEHKGGKGTKLALKTGGVAMGAAGYAAGGGVKMGNGGGFKKGGEVMSYVDGNVAGTPPGKTNTTTGGVKKSNAGGFKKGGSAKKAYATGGLVDSGRPVAMPEGRKKPSAPVSINQLSGTFKKGGSVKRLNDGGDAQSDKETKGYKGTYATQKAENLADREAMNPFNIFKDLYGKARDAVRGQGSVSDKESSILSDIEKGVPSPARGQGSVTKTERSVTVSPAVKKRGGMANC